MDPIPPLPDLAFDAIFPTTGSEVPRNLRIWYRPSSSTVDVFGRSFLEPYLALPDGKIGAFDMLRHDIEMNSYGPWYPIVEIVPKWEETLLRQGPDRWPGLYPAGMKVAVRAAEQSLAEYTISDTIDDVPPSPPRVTLAERSVAGGQPSARFTLEHDPVTLVAAVRHPHIEPDRDVLYGVTASNELLLVNHPDWAGAAVFDFYAIDVAGNWSTATHVEVPDFGVPDQDEGPIPLELKVWGPLRAQRSEGASLIVEGTRTHLTTVHTVRHEALSAVSATSTAPCLVSTAARPGGWFDLQISSPVDARCTLSIHGEANGESADKTAEIELLSAGKLVRRERRSPCRDASPWGHWHLPNGTDVCPSDAPGNMIWQLPDGQLRTVMGGALTLLDPTHVLVCTDARCAAVDELGKETSPVPRPPGFPRDDGDEHLSNRGLTPADTLPRVLTGSVSWPGTSIDLLRWDGSHLTAGTQPNQLAKSNEGPRCGWGNDWAVGFDVLGQVAAFATASGDMLWRATPSQPYDGWYDTPELQVAEPWMRFHDQLYSAPGVALPDRLPPGIRIRAISGCFIGADTYPDRDRDWWTAIPYHGLWWFDVCSTPMRQVMTNTSEHYEYMVVDAEGLWGQTRSGRWDFFGLAP